MKIRLLKLLPMLRDRSVLKLFCLHFSHTVVEKIACLAPPKMSNLDHLFNDLSIWKHIPIFVQTNLCVKTGSISKFEPEYSEVDILKHIGSSIAKKGKRSTRNAGWPVVQSNNTLFV